MEHQSIQHGGRKGKQTAFKQMFSGVVSKSLRVFPVPGLDVLLAKGFNSYQKGVNIATTPKHSNVLLVTSPLPGKLTTFAANVYAQMPRPRLLVFIGSKSIEPLPPPHFVLSADEINLLSQKISFFHAWSEEAVVYELPATDDGKNIYTCPMHPEVQSDQPGNCPKCGMALVKKDDEGKEKQRHKQDTQNHHQHSTENDLGTHEMKAGEHKGHDMKGHDMSKKESHGDTAGMSGIEDGFMSMVQMTKDMPRSKDGLAMEMNDAFFGPFHPGLPGGLLVKMKLDGDTVMKATIEREIASPHLLHHFPKSLSQLPHHLSQLNPLLHSTYHLLVYKALSNIAGSNDLVDEVQILEKDRIGSHLNWLSLFSRTIGDRELHYHASKLCYEFQSGKAAKANILKLTGNARKTPYLKKRLTNTGIIPEHLLQSVTGPIARAARMEKDIRQSMSAYQQRNFKPIVLHENNAWGQLLVRLAEIEQSIELIGDENLNKKIILPEINSNDLHGEQKGEVALEAPNGNLELSIEINDGKVKSVAIEGASKVLADLVPEITKAQELSNALVSIASLDISPMEMDA